MKIYHRDSGTSRILKVVSCAALSIGFVGSLALAGDDNSRSGEKETTSGSNSDDLGLDPSLRILTDKGSDRATAYVMSNKIVRRGDHYLVTWIDAVRTNHWALLDRHTAKTVKQGTVGEERRDNHCGSALAKDIDGTIHMMVGGHFTKLAHYRLPPESDDWQLVEDGAAIGEKGPGRSPTYPSLVCDNEGTLHLTYRSEPRARDAVVSYCRRPKDGKWSKPITLIENLVKEHSWMHNAIQDAPDGRLHVLAAVTLPIPKVGTEARYYGAAHIYSDDQGQTWRQFDQTKPLTLPVLTDKLSRIEGPTMELNRTSPTYRGKDGPGHAYVFRMMLSNISLDAEGNPRIVMGNLMEGNANLWSYSKESGWKSQPLRGHVDALTKKLDRPRFRIQHLGTLARLPQDELEMVLMVSPVASTGWGAEYTRLVRLRFDSQLRFQDIHLIGRNRSREADWIPSLEYFNYRDPYEFPALMFTRGLNAGGYSNNVNDIETKVIFQLPTRKGSKDIRSKRVGITGPFSE